MKENDKQAKALLITGIFILCCCVSAVSFHTGRYVEGVYWSEHVEPSPQNQWVKDMEQSSYDRAFSEWGNFECTFDNETLTLETECGGHGYTTITIFSHPVVNLSLGVFWDKYQTTEKWEEKDVDEVWITDAEENVLVIPKKWIAPEIYLQIFELMNTSAASWNFNAPANTCTRHIIDIQDNISSNLTIVVRKDIGPFSYMDTMYRFEPVIYTFEVRT